MQEVRWPEREREGCDGEGMSRPSRPAVQVARGVSVETKGVGPPEQNEMMLLQHKRGKRDDEPSARGSGNKGY